MTSDDFESGFGNWVDGGDDVTLSSNNAIGAQCVDLQDDGGDASAIWLINNLDLSNSSQLKIEFTYMPISFEAVEDFYLQYSSNGGSNWTTIKAYVNGVDFSDGVREYISITIDSGSYSFTSRAKLRFEGSASSNSDDIYLDNVVISAFGGECNVFADFTCDGLVEVDDLLYMASVWLTNDGTADIAQPTRGIKGVRYLD